MKRRLLDFARNMAGIAAVEFALIAPVLIFFLVGLAEFGLALNQYVELTEGVRVGTRQLALSRTDSTPYTDTTNAVKNAAPQLNLTNSAITVSVNGAACSSDAACSTALGSAEGTAATVSASFTCSVIVMGHNFLPSCSLYSTSTEIIE